MFSNFQKNRLKAGAIPTLFDTIGVDRVDEPKNNDDPECSTDFVSLSCSTPGMNIKYIIVNTIEFSLIVGRRNNLFHR